MSFWWTFELNLKSMECFGGGTDTGPLVPWMWSRSEGEGRVDVP
jgi:hypothetical protein